MHRWIFLGKVWLLEAAIRFSLWVLPFATLQRLVRRWGRRPSWLEHYGSRQPETLACAVRYAARFLPRANCLTQALATQVLLSRAGHGCHLCIGVKQCSGGELQAHAWVESEGKVVIGGGELALFVQLPTLEQTYQ